MPKKTDPLPENDLLSAEMLRAVRIDDMILDEEFISLPAQLAYWNARYAKALRTYLLEEHELEVVKARLHMTRRGEQLLPEEDGEDAAESKKGKGKAKSKLTVDDIKALVLQDPEYREAALRAIEAEAEKERLRRFCDAVAAKKDMLQSLGAKLRIEMMGDPVIRDQHRALRGGSRDD